MKIFTSRFTCKELKNFDAVKVQISMYKPKFPTGFAVTESCGMLAPWGIPWNDNFKAKYWAKLDMYGVDKIKRYLNVVSKRNDGKDLVLLCFENIKEGKTCHRRYFAEWWQERTGEVIEEYDPVVAQEIVEGKPTIQQMTLF
jgi:hypothetical protein